MPEIVVRSKDGEAERVITEKDRISIGRSADNDIVLYDGSASRHHARIEVTERGATVFDQRSLNGTFVNGVRVTQKLLSDNDVLTIGKYELFYYTDSRVARRFMDINGRFLKSNKRQKSFPSAQTEMDTSETRPISVPVPEIEVSRKEP